MALLSIEELKRPTLQLLAEGVTDSDEIRRRIAQDCGFDPAATPRFTNNHAWALVRLQQEDLIQKLGLKEYIITKNGGDFLKGLKPPSPRTSPAPRVGAMPAWARQQIRKANARNSDRWPDTKWFTDQDMATLWDCCQGRCAITRLPFTEEKIGTGAAKRAFAPSLDRINPEKPYTVDNCRLVMVAVNFALNRWGDEVYLKLARASVEAAPRSGT